jgi:class 3 adenylate cyclase
VIGVATNIASRLCSEAKAGQILVTDSFFEKYLSGEFTQELIGEIRLKGIKIPIKVHNIIEKTL